MLIPDKAPNGRIYYFNKMTQKSVWEKPESMMTAGEKHLANCPWKSHKNTDGKVFFGFYFTYRFESCWSNFSKITHFLERISMEHIELICSFESELSLTRICSIRIPSGNQDIFEKSLHNEFLGPLPSYNSATVGSYPMRGKDAGTPGTPGRN